MQCKYCGNQLPDHANFCDNCGRSVTAIPAQPVTAPPEEKKSYAAGCIIAFVIFLLLLLLTVLCIRYLPMFLDISLPQSTSGNHSYTADTGTSEKETNPVALLPGNPNLTYKDCFAIYDSYVLPDSDRSFKCYTDIHGLSKAELRIAQEEIYARHGASFADPDIQAYFNARTWYTSRPGEIALNQFEEGNLCLLRIYNAIQDGTLYITDNPYLNQCPWEYVLPDSNVRNQGATDLQYLTKEQLIAARNEILARHGYVFTSKELQEYFYSKPWYSPTAPKESFNTGVLSKTENQNIAMIQLYEKRAKGVSFSSGNPYAGIYNANRLYLFPYSDTVQLTNADMAGKTKTELELGYHEIYARHGFTFTDNHLLEYFLQFSWYAPDTLPGDSSTIVFSQIEEYNLKVLQKGPSNSGNSGNTGNTGSTGNTNVPVIVSHDKYTYTLEKNGKVLYCYHIPYVPGIPESVNQKMYDTCYTSLQNNVFNYSDNLMFTGLYYTVGQYQDAMSVTVRWEHITDCDGYDVYNFSASTGATLSDAQVFAVFGLTEQQGRDLIRTALTQYWDSYASRIPEEDRGVCAEARNRTLADSNINQIKPYIDANGNLMFAGKIYSIAGADSYQHLFNPNGITRTFSCKVH